jgi:hypothetical protein
MHEDFLDAFVDIVHAVGPNDGISLKPMGVDGMDRNDAGGVGIGFGGGGGGGHLEGRKEEEEERELKQM